MLSPTCENCGCVLEAYRAGEREDERAPVVPAPRSGRVTRLAPAVLMLAPTALAARIGLDHGGVLLAVLAAVLTLMLLGGLGYRQR